MKVKIQDIFLCKYIHGLHNSNHFCGSIVLALISNLFFPAELQFIVANITHIPVCICKIEMLKIEGKKKYELIDLDQYFKKTFFKHIKQVELWPKR